MRSFISLSFIEEYSWPMGKACFFSRNGKAKVWIFVFWLLCTTLCWTLYYVLWSNSHFDLWGFIKIFKCQMRNLRFEDLPFHLFMYHSIYMCKRKMAIFSTYGFKKWVFYKLDYNSRSKKSQETISKMKS